MHNSFEYYKQLLNDMVLDINAVTMYDASDIGLASFEERGRLAFYSLEELDRCNDALETNNVLIDEAYSILLSLTNSLSMYDGFSYEDFAYVLDNGSSFIMRHIVLNPVYPLSFLVNDDLYVKYKSSSNWVSLETALKLGRNVRAKEVATFFRGEITGSEPMSDEMVLSIAGIAL